MKDWFAEFLVVLSHSRRTQWAIFLGVFGFVAINLWGDYQLSDFELSGHIDSIGAVIKEKFLRRYDKVALGCLISFFLLAIKLYRKDRKRFYGMYFRQGASVRGLRPPNASVVDPLCFSVNPKFECPLCDQGIL